MYRALPPVSRTDTFRTLFCSLFLLSTVATVGAQVIIEREFIGASTVIVSPPAATVEMNDLLVDASSGEPLIGYTGPGDIQATIGFQQSFRDEFNAPAIQPDFNEDVLAERLLVRTFPNPTTEEVTVDLSKANHSYEVLRLLNNSGVTVQLKTITNQPQGRFRQLDQLPSGTYYLQGIDDAGNARHLGAVVILSRSN